MSACGLEGRRPKFRLLNEAPSDALERHNNLDAQRIKHARVPTSESRGSIVVYTPKHQLA
jgi:hypothetical protein